MTRTTDVATEGMLLVDKPEGPTSHEIVDVVRGLTGQRRVGHAGTLDPPASGLLPIVLGCATRLVRFLPHSPKVYEGRLRLGLTTTTDDLTGEVLVRYAGPPPTADAVRREARRLTGTLHQVPPAISARKVGGRRLYRLARGGRPASAPPAVVEVECFDLQPTADPAEWSFVARVSPGTYVRALARDLGAALDTGGVVAALRRVAIGPLSVADAVRLPAAGQGPGAAAVAARVVPPESMPLVPPPVELVDSETRRRFLAGSAVELDAPPPGDGPCRVLDAATGRLLGIGFLSGATLRPRVVLVRSLPG